MNYNTAFCMFELVKLPNFILNWQFKFFGLNLPKKVFPVINIVFCIFELVSIPKLSLNSKLSDNFDFPEQTFQKRVFSVKNRKREHHHWILHMWISEGTKFQLKLIILIFWTNLLKKSISHRNMNTNIEFRVSELL